MNLRTYLRGVEAADADVPLAALRPQQSAPERRPPRTTGVVVIGAGPSGLAAARRLRALGLPHVVLEAAPHAGGSSRRERLEGREYPVAAHFTGAPASELMRELYAEAGWCDAAGAVVNVARPPLRNVWHRGAWERMDDFTHAPATLACWSDEERRRIRRFLAEAARIGAPDDEDEDEHDDPDLHAYDALSLGDVLRRHGCAQSFGPIAELFTRDCLGAPPDGVSAWTGLGWLGEREDAVVTAPGGLGGLVAHLARAEPELYTSCPVTQVTPGAATVKVTLGNDQTLEARACILAVPAHVSRRLYPELERDLGGLEHASWIVLALAVDAPPEPREVPLAWVNFVTGRTALGVVVGSHVPRAGTPASGADLLSVYLPLGDRAEGARLATEPARVWVARTLQELEATLPGLSASVTAAALHYWPDAMVVARPGLASSLARRRLQEPAGRVVLAHTDSAGAPSFELAVHAGDLAARRIASLVREG